MSTADLLIIAILQLVSVEIVYPLRPKSTPRQIGWVGQFVSLLAIVVGLLIGLFWKGGISDMTSYSYFRPNSI